MAFSDEIVKAYAGRPACRNGTLETADGWIQFEIATVLGVEAGTVILCAFTAWNVTAGTDAEGAALDPLPVIRISNEPDPDLRDARSLTIAPDRDAKGFTFHPGEYVRSVWLKAEGADCAYEFLAEHEATAR